MELVTCNNIKVTVVLLHTEEGVANSTICERRLCNSVRWPWHSNTPLLATQRCKSKVE
jgi:hypothetical protein